MRRFYLALPGVPGLCVALAVLGCSSASQPASSAGPTTSAVASLSMTALTFTVNLGSVAAAQTVTLSNSGNGPLVLSTISVRGANAASFNETNNCGNRVAAGSSCTLTLSLNAYLAMSYSASVTIDSNVVVSLGLASTYGSVVAQLNGHQLIWHYVNSSDAMIRSGLSGYTQWLVLDWPESYLNATGADNVLTFGVSQIGWMPDAIRMEITNNNGDPATTGWHDYEYVNASKYTPANDAVPNP